MLRQQSSEGRRGHLPRGAGRTSTRRLGWQARGTAGVQVAPEEVRRGYGRWWAALGKEAAPKTKEGPLRTSAEGPVRWWHQSWTQWMPRNADCFAQLIGHPVRFNLYEWKYKLLHHFLKITDWVVVLHFKWTDGYCVGYFCAVHQQSSTGAQTRWILPLPPIYQ